MCEQVAMPFFLWCCRVAWSRACCHFWYSSGLSKTITFLPENWTGRMVARQLWLCEVINHDLVIIQKLRGTGVRYSRRAEVKTGKLVAMKQRHGEGKRLAR